MLNSSGSVSWGKRILYIGFPFAINLCFLIFIGVSIDVNQWPSWPVNSIPLTLVFLHYLTGIAMLFTYGKTVTDGFYDMFLGTENMCLHITLVLSYPIFFLFRLPVILFRFIVYIGTPCDLWDRIFEGTGGSLDNLRPENAPNGFDVFVRGIYIGIPFFIFSVIYMGVLIFLSPIWYFIFSPVGLSTYGTCLAVSMQADDSNTTSYNDRVDQSYPWGLFINVFILNLEYMFGAISYIALVGSEWQAVLLLIVTLFYLVCGCYPAIKHAFCDFGGPCNNGY